MEGNHKLRVCVYLWHTPYVLLNFWNILSHDPEFINAEIDYITPSWNKETVQFLPNVRNVFFLIHVKEHRIIPVRILKSMGRYLFWRHYADYYFSGEKKFSSMEYDVIILPGYTVEGILCKLCNPKAKVYLCEEGTLSYISDHPLSPRPTGRIALLLIGKIKNIRACDAIFVNGKKAFTELNSKYADRVRQIPPIALLDEESLAAINREIGGTSSINYSQKKYIYLTQGFSNPQNIVQEFQILCDEQFCIRKHPFDKCEYTGTESEQGKALWEIICAKEITDNHVLIGAFSTAQIAPKWFFDKEPFVIFTYPYFEKADSGRYLNAYRKILETTKKLYRNPEKIFEVKELTDIPIILKKIKEHDLENQDTVSAI